MSRAEQAKGFIDVHHHIVPDFYAEALAKLGIREAGGRALPTWSPELALEVMDENRIATAITSISAPGVHFGNDGDARDLARRCNDYTAELGRLHPARFGGFAVLPLPDAEGALKEAEYALDTLKLDGIVLLSSMYGGARPADPRFAELFDFLHERKAVVFLHPDRTVEAMEPDPIVPPFLVDYVYDTTRAVAELIYSGTLDRASDVRMILAHAGGTVPYISWRLSQLESYPDYKERLPNGVMWHLKRFYYDTALSASRYTFRCLQELAGDTQILFGSDFAFVPPQVVQATVRRVTTYDGFDAEGQKKVEALNAGGLFPRFAP